MRYDFPKDIEAAIRRACLRASARRWRANFIHADTGEPTASLGRLSGGLFRIGVYDDLIVGPHKGKWAVLSDRGELRGLYATAATLERGILKAAKALHARRADTLDAMLRDGLALRQARRTVARRSRAAGAANDLQSAMTA